MPLTATGTIKSACRATMCDNCDTEVATMRGTHQNPVTVADETAACMERKRRGMTLRQIAADLGLSKDTVSRRIDAGIAAVISTSVDDLRVSATAEMAELRKALTPGIKNGEVPAIAEARRVNESLRRLHGVDAPTVSVLQLEARNELEAQAVVAALMFAVPLALELATDDPDWRSELRTYAFQLAQYKLSEDDDGVPTRPLPQPPVRFTVPALDPGTGAEPWGVVPAGPDVPSAPRPHAPGPDVPFPGLTPAERAILDAVLAETEDDDDE